MVDGLEGLLEAGVEGWSPDDDADLFAVEIKQQRSRM